MNFSLSFRGSAFGRYRLLVKEWVCSARLQAGILEPSKCPPEGGRYMNHG